MKYCQQCGQQLDDAAIFCSNCGFRQSMTNESGAREIDDSVNVFYVVLSFLFPIFGLVYSIAKRKERPRCAKYCGIATTISYALTYFMLMMQ